MTRLSQHVLLRRGALALALAAVAGAATAATPPPATPDVATDAAGAWTRFLAEARFETAYKAYAALDAVGYDGGTADAEACRTNAGALREALATAPVSVALHRAAMLCAEANGDVATAEREMLAVAALAKHAFAAPSEGIDARPVRVLRQHDMRALLLALGLEPLYARFPETRARRYFPLVIAAWDPEKKVERHLSFDFVDVGYRLLREPEAQYPFSRSEIVEATLGASREANISEGVDAMAWKEARSAEDTATRIAKLRMGTNAGGMQSARTWLAVCIEQGAPANCAEGLVDALLPLAEGKSGYATMLLAYAYAHGTGVPRDVEAAERLLDAADARWPGASVEYARLWYDDHGTAATPPETLLRRLVRAQAAGSEDARRLQLDVRLSREPTAGLGPGDITFLSQPSQNGRGGGYALLADWAEERKSVDEHKRWRKLAADAGNADAQADEGFWLAYDDAGPEDEAAGLAYFEEAAHGGSVYGARMRGYEAARRHQYAAAERWLTDAASRAFDSNALLDVADLYEWRRPGVSGNPERAVLLYRQMADMDIAEARRRLARMAMTGRNIPKNPAQARVWLEVDANKGDHESEGMLGLSLLESGGDEADATRWVERAIAGGDRGTSAGYGHWLFYKKATPAARTKAVDVWRAGVRNHDDGAANNYAWALCTAPVEAFRDVNAGLAATVDMGKLDDMGWGAQDTVAACRAATGDFDGAVALQKRVLEGWRASLEGQAPDAEQQKQTKELEDRLVLYQARKPYIEQPEHPEG